MMEDKPTQHTEGGVLVCTVALLAHSRRYFYSFHMRRHKKKKKWVWQKPMVKNVERGIWSNCPMSYVEGEVK